MLVKEQQNIQNLEQNNYNLKDFYIDFLHQNILQKFKKQFVATFVKESIWTRGGMAYTKKVALPTSPATSVRKTRVGFHAAGIGLDMDFDA